MSRQQGGFTRGRDRRGGAATPLLSSGTPLTIIDPVVERPPRDRYGARQTPRVERPSITVVDYKISSFCSFGDCVEVGQLASGSVSVRDTKDPNRHSLVFTHDEWDAFVKGVKAGEFDPA